MGDVPTGGDIGAPEDRWSVPVRIACCLASAIGSWALLVRIVELTIGA